MLAKILRGTTWGGLRDGWRVAMYLPLRFQRHHRAVWLMAAKLLLAAELPLPLPLTRRLGRHGSQGFLFHALGRRSRSRSRSNKLLALGCAAPTEQQLLASDAPRHRSSSYPNADLCRRSSVRPFVTRVKARRPLGTCHLHFSWCAWCRGGRRLGERAAAGLAELLCRPQQHVEIDSRWEVRRSRSEATLDTVQDRFGFSWTLFSPRHMRMRPTLTLWSSHTI
jgi:hypothetical protein